MTTMIYTTDAEEALHNLLGLPLEAVAEAARIWWTEVRAVDPFRPRNGAAFAGWDHGTGALRLAASRFGYQPKNEKGVPLAMNRERGTAIQLLAGTGASGDQRRTPTTKNARGKVAGYVALAQQSFQGWSKEHVATGFSTWIVLPCVLPSGALRFEVSRARALDTNGNVIAWHERIIPCPLDGVQPGRRIVAPDPTDEIVIPTRRRG